MVGPDSPLVNPISLVAEKRKGRPSGESAAATRMELLRAKGYLRRPDRLHLGKVGMESQETRPMRRQQPWLGTIAGRKTERVIAARPTYNARGGTTYWDGACHPGSAQAKRKLGTAPLYYT